MSKKHFEITFEDGKTVKFSDTMASSKLAEKTACKTTGEFVQGSVTDLSIQLWAMAAVNDSEITQEYLDGMIGEDELRAIMKERTGGKNPPA